MQHPKRRNNPSIMKPNRLQEVDLWCTLPYLPPTNKDAYSNACANVLTELKAKVIRSSKKEVIVVEEETKKQLSKKASEEHFPSTSEILPVLNDDGSVAAALYKYTVDDTTFRILVTTSWHISSVVISKLYLL